MSDPNSSTRSVGDGDTRLPVEGGISDMPDGLSGQDTDLEELRRIILGQEHDALSEKLDKISALQEDGQLEALSKLLPDAIALSGDDKRLIHSLTLPVERTMLSSIKQNPKPMVDAIYPAIGPAIRRAIAEALASMVESINQTLEHSLSVKSLRWRLEAWRADKKFSEVVMAHTLSYRVEQLFLIDLKTALPIQHVYVKDADVKDTDLASGVFSAIQDFTSDVFFSEEHGEPVRNIEIGDLVITTEKGPRAYLAAVVRGTPTPELSEQLKELIEAIHLQFGNDLDTFSGEMEPFSHLRPLLNTGLLSQLKEGRKTRKRSPILWLLFAVLLVGFAWWGITSISGYLKWNRYLAHLKSVPGLVVTETSLENGKWRVEGLRDQWAPHPDSLLGSFDIAPSTVDGQWESYLSLDQSLVLARANALLDPPATASLSVEQGLLKITGSASAAWVAGIRSQLPFVYGITGFDDTGLQVTEATIGELAEKIRSTSILFSAGSSNITPPEEAKLLQLVDDVSQAFAISSMHLNVIGHASADGSESINAQLSEARATNIMGRLIALGLPDDRLHRSSDLPA